MIIKFNAVTIGTWHGAFTDLLRMLAGSVGHQRGKCSCHGGADEGDPPGMTRREAARAAAALYEGRCLECGGLHGEHDEDCQDAIDTVVVEDAD